MKEKWLKKYIIWQPVLEICNYKMYNNKLNSIWKALETSKVEIRLLNTVGSS